MGNEEPSGQQAVEPWQIVRASMVEQAGDDNPSRVARNILHALRNAGFTVSRTAAPTAPSTAAADTARLDFLDRCNARLNAESGTSYHWKLTLNHNVSRLMLGHLEVDLNDAEARGLPSCRDAIDAKMRECGTPVLASAPSTVVGEPALVCGCGWEGSYADLNETAEGMTCPKCRLSRNMDCAATPPAQESNPFRAAMHDAYVASEGGVTWHEDDPKQTLGEIVAWTMNFIDAATPEPSVPQPGLELDRAMDAALLRSAKIIDMPWQEQAAQIRRDALEEAARICRDEAMLCRRDMRLAPALSGETCAYLIRALLSKPAKGEG